VTISLAAQQNLVAVANRRELKRAHLRSPSMTKDLKAKTNDLKKKMKMKMKMKMNGPHRSRQKAPPQVP
jgi:hypothetical protein